MRYLLISFFLLGLGCAQNTVEEPVIRKAPDRFLPPTLSANPSHMEYENHCWELMAYVSQPAKLTDNAVVPGVLDKNKKIGAMRGNTHQIALWDSWATSQDVYRAKGATPYPWEKTHSQVNMRPKAVGLITPMGMTQGTNGSNGGLVSIWGDAIPTHVKLNKPTFDYVVKRKLYNIEGQLEFFKDDNAKPISFPTDSMEAKASWIVIRDESKLDKYYTQPAVLSSCADANWKEGDDCSEYKYEDVTVGLGSMHLISRIIPNWVWCTFIHEDNFEVGRSKTGRLAMHPQTLETQQVNKAWNIKNSGNFLAHYQSNGVMYDYYDDKGQPVMLGNSLIETNDMPNSSCLSCHQASTIGVVNGKPGRISPSIYRLENGAGRGIVGQLPNEYFSNYKTLELIWSVLEAQSSSTPAIDLQYIEVCDLAAELNLIYSEACDGHLTES